MEVGMELGKEVIAVLIAARMQLLRRAGRVGRLPADVFGSGERSGMLWTGAGPECWCRPGYRLHTTTS